VSAVLPAPDRRFWLPFFVGGAVVGVAVIVLSTVSHSATFPRTGPEGALAAYVIGGLAVGAFRPAWWWGASVGVLACSFVAPWVATVFGAESVLSIIIYPPGVVRVPVLLTGLFTASITIARIVAWAVRWSAPRSP
jgi:hypothetical protein